MSRNFGLGSRNMDYAGLLALKKEMLSFSSVTTESSRWGQFVKWLKPQGINRMEHVEREDILRYGEYLLYRIECEELGVATVHNYLSAVNRVFNIARRDKKLWVSPVDDCGVPERSGICTESKACNDGKHAEAKQNVSERTAILMGLQRMFGLRFEESCKLDAKRGLREASALQKLTIEAGTKGGRQRLLPILMPDQLLVLEKASEVQGSHYSMIPSGLTYVEFQRQAYREASAVKLHFHSERHAYAHARYLVEAGCECPVVSGYAHGLAHHKYVADKLGCTVNEAREIDCQVRMKIARELGHARIQITNSYYG
ncbi:MAG: integrase domain-containing protein [Pseudomonadota bacterium]|nr:integrase domain-containing protein [Pseudomonadota bacterium]